MGAAGNKHCEAGFHRWVRHMQVIRDRDHIVRTCQVCLKQEVVLTLHRQTHYAASTYRSVPPFGS
jgi:hypothetical protein